MRGVKVMVALFMAGGAAFLVSNTATVVADSDQNGKIALLDDCDPTIGAGWNVPGNLNGCLRDEGTVSRAEFGAFLTSPLSLSVVGHPSWTISPTYITPNAGKRLRVTNEGGRGHTFTEVAEYGGGFVGMLNQGLAPATECAAAAGAVIPPGERIEIAGLAVGTHKFQCCIHPWMRADVKVLPH
jgi:plastocyanin